MSRRRALVTNPSAADMLRARRGPMVRPVIVHPLAPMHNVVPTLSLVNVPFIFYPTHIGLEPDPYWAAAPGDVIAKYGLPLHAKPKHAHAGRAD